ncbi:catalase [Corynebacterium ureicelerivorans]|uniref:catalase n=1 Tax=Corynebacterium ureicelerivorans TaxID=401472 RepID=UPI00264C8D95|nr:catalase [Corynebacterium ureicelerivorans]MDN8606073.1 catalase [Corynebacterium ureicelerivorans]
MSEPNQTPSTNAASPAGDTAPGTPGGITPGVEQPEGAVNPPQDTEAQQAPAPVTPTGCPFHVGAAAGAGAGSNPDPRAQQGEYLTTAQGARLSETSKSLRAGERGPLLMQDHHFREKITHFDHERIPERVVHARGVGAHGVFVANGNASKISKAAVFKKDKETPVFVRFSTVLGSRGSADTVRDTRGWATKFYTEEGTWDLVGNNIPVFFIQDGIKFPDVIHAGKPHPDREIPQAQSAHDTFWDFVGLHTEATHHTLWNMSDRGIPRSLRMMEGFGIHTFRFINDAGETTLVKFHWKPKFGVHSQVWEEAQITGGMDPDFHRRDLYDAIEAGAFPRWDLGVQVFPDTEDQLFEGIDLLDPTKIVPEELAPVQIIGTMTLNKNPRNYFEETEQVAFHPGHLVPGIDVTADPLLQGRLFSYLDTQISRLGGPNFAQLPINRPQAPVNDNLRDGMHQVGSHTGVAPYKPNSLDGGNPAEATVDEGALIDVPVAVSGTITREQPASFDDHFSQARLFYISLSEVEQAHLADAVSFELGKCYEEAVKVRYLDVLAHVDQDLAETVADNLGLPHPDKQDVADVQPSPALSQMGGTWPIDGRQVGILISTDLDEASAQAVGVLVDELFAAGTTPLLVAEKGGAVTLGGRDVSISRTYLTASSIEFDAAVVVNPPAKTDVNTILGELERHKKAIVVVGEAGKQALEGARVPVDQPGIVAVDAADAAAAPVKELLASHRVWER